MVVDVPAAAVLKDAVGVVGAPADTVVVVGVPAADVLEDAIGVVEALGGSDG